MHKKHMFLRVFSKITTFACVFCTISALAETICDTNFTPIMGNSIQNGTPTPETPVNVISVGDRTVNLWVLGDFTPGAPATKTLEGLDPNKTYVISILASNDFITTSPTSWSVSPRNADGTSRGNVFYMKNYVAGQMVSAQFDGASMLRIQVVGMTGSLHVMLTEGSTVPTEYIPYGYQIPIVGTSANGSQITTSVYLNAPLRKVGDYADVLDYKNGTITRNVGVLVLDGVTAGAKIGAAWNPTYKRGSFAVSDMKSTAASVSDALSSHLEYSQAVYGAPTVFGFCTNNGSVFISFLGLDNVTSVDTANAYLAQQYANGTPVTVYYPLATPVVEQIENWSCTPPITEIKIATTKFVDEEFAAAEAKLAATVQTIESIVSRTITQTGQIQVLQDTKQTRPDESCPANMKCLLVQDEDGTPHWYPIIEP